MKFVFLNKNPVETDIIIDILTNEHIGYKIKEQAVSIISTPFISTELITYDIEINTSLEYFDFINKIANKKMKQLLKLERCYIENIKRRSRKNEKIT